MKKASRNPVETGLRETKQSNDRESSHEYGNTVEDVYEDLSNLTPKAQNRSYYEEAGREDRYVGPSYNTTEVTRTYVNTSTKNDNPHAVATTSLTTRNSLNDKPYEPQDKSGPLDVKLPTPTKRKKSTCSCGCSLLTSHRILLTIIIILSLATVGLLVAIIVISVTGSSADHDDRLIDGWQTTDLSAANVTSKPTTTTASPVISNVLFAVALHRQSSSLNDTATNITDGQFNKTNSQFNNLTQPANSRIVIYNIPLFNEGSSYDNVTGHFIAPSDGHYWFHWSVGVPNRTMCNYTLTSHNLTLRIFKALNSYDGIDMLSRDNLVSLLKDQSLFIESSEPLYSDQWYQTAWLGFRLDTLMNPFISFSVTGTNFFSNSSVTMTFDTILVDTHNTWNIRSNGYVIPQTGIYFITYYASSSRTETQAIHLQVNNTSLLNYPYLNLRPGNETSSISYITSFHVGDIVSLFLSASDIVGNHFYQTSFSGFHYQPINSLLRIAWSVVNQKEVLNDTYPLPFNIILMNDGFGWHFQRNEFIAPENGLYYISVAGSNHQNYRLHLRVMLNSQTVCTLQREFPALNGPVTRSQASVVRLAQSDVLSIKQFPSYGVYQPFFTGFRLYL